MIHQVSEFYRQGVLRPLDEKAKDDLEHFCVSASIRCEWLPILNDAQFGSIWESGLLQTIGHRCNLRFSDYEEIFLDVDQVGQAAIAVKEFLANSANNDGRLFAEALLGLMLDAEASETPVLFVL